MGNTALEILNDYDVVFHPENSTFPAKLGIRIEGDALCGIDFLPPTAADLKPAGDLATTTINQLERYFRDPNIQFDLPLSIEGTDHRKRVWGLLREIPVGAVRTYGGVAKSLNSSARAVGSACRTNPLPLIIPCHRVVARQGIGGFSGQTEGYMVKIKQWLLSHEGHRY